MKLSRKYYTVTAALALFGAVNMGMSAPAQAHGDRICRDYTKTSFINGFRETGYAQACTRGGGYWDVVSLNAPVELRSYLLGMINEDVIRLGGLRISFDGYSAPPSRTYYTDIRETRVRYVPVPAYYNKKGYKKYDRYDRYNQHDHYDRDRRDDNHQDKWRHDERRRDRD